MHFGSLVAAVGSYLDAKHHDGIWLVRMENLDTPRCVPGAAHDILRTLEAFGLHSDGTLICQSSRTAAYEEALHRLKAIAAVYPCCCTRREITDSALLGIDGFVYPGTCRNGKSHPLPGGEETTVARTPAWRVRTDLNPSLFSLSSSQIEFDDALQGRISQHLERDIGDFVVKRADGLFAYQLAVVVDDAFQNITHIVRGADLLYSTPRQIYLQRLLGLATPTHMHLPIAVNAQGEKLSKQTLAPAIGRDDAVTTLMRVLKFLQQQPPEELRGATVGQILLWGTANWKPEKLTNCRQYPV